MRQARETMAFRFLELLWQVMSDTILVIYTRSVTDFCVATQKKNRCFDSFFGLFSRFFIFLMHLNIQTSDEVSIVTENSWVIFSIDFFDD